MAGWFRALWRRRSRLAATIGSLVLLIGCVVVPLVGLTWLVFFTDAFLIRAITVVDAREHTAEQVKALMGDVTNKNILFVSTELLEGKIQQEVPQIRSVHIVRKLPDTIKVLIQEKQPHVLLLSNGKYYFVDEAGIAYEEARIDTLPGIVLPIIKNVAPGGAPALGGAVVEETFVTFVKAIVDKLPEAAEGVQAVEVRIPSLAAREVHILVNTNWEVRFDSTRSAQAQLAVLRQLLTETLSEEERAGLEYIDLRIPNRVYYRSR